MKKIKYLLIAILSMAMLVALVALVACGDNPDGPTGDGGGVDGDEWTIVTPPTCESTGLREKEVDGQTVQDVIPALGHSYGNWQTVDEPTCTEGGLRTRTCSRCSDVDEEILKPNGHSTENGWTYDEENHYYKCDVCKEQIDFGEHEIVFVESRALRIYPIIELLADSISPWAQYWGLNGSRLEPSYTEFFISTQLYYDYGYENLYECEACGAEFSECSLLEEYIESSSTSSGYQYQYNENNQITMLKSIVVFETGEKYVLSTYEFSYDEMGRVSSVIRSSRMSADPEAYRLERRLLFDYTNDNVITIVKQNYNNQSQAYTNDLQYDISIDEQGRIYKVHRYNPFYGSENSCVEEVEYDENGVIIKYSERYSINTEFDCEYNIDSHGRIIGDNFNVTYDEHGNIDFYEHIDISNGQNGYHFDYDNFYDGEKITGVNASRTAKSGTVRSYSMRYVYDDEQRIIGVYYTNNANTDLNAGDAFDSGSRYVIEYNDYGQVLSVKGFSVTYGVETSEPYMSFTASYSYSMTLTN